MLARLHDLSGPWRLCLALCVPLFAAVAYYYAYEVDSEPPLSFTVWVAHESFTVTGWTEIGYRQNASGAVHGSRQWYNEIGGTAAAIPGYRIVFGTGDWNYWFVASERLPADVVDRAGQEVLRKYNRANSERWWKQFSVAAYWLAIGAAPFFLYWTLYFVGRWVWTGFTQTRKSA